eukprot:CAMPEP_0204167876 /NCGR_PEP_ID=MMETSP0361-20130328/40245_1 /ASSEMBLY_ACC=CAM_ASM_000343 /TAXON_ID=268821 /ORGANISM="Scrippsiella Hangoei, Strain SHTV-5" /LENGTH=92 /DNA_ID=CAMNT_0051125257 /DNA_START=342 /DNA_END=618 /DNA_ORIENTATION=+
MKGRSGEVNLRTRYPNSPDTTQALSTDEIVRTTLQESLEIRDQVAAMPTSREQIQCQNVREVKKLEGALNADPELDAAGERVPSACPQRAPE